MRLGYFTSVKLNFDKVLSSLAVMLISPGLVFAQIKINEVYYNVSPQGGNQFVELYNPGPSTAFLDGMILTDEAGSGIEGVYQFPGTPGQTNLSLASGAFIYIAVDATGATINANWECFAGGVDTDNPSVSNLALVSGSDDFGLFAGGDNVILGDGTDTVAPISQASVVDGMNYGGGNGELAPLSSSAAEGNGNETSSASQSLVRCPDGFDTNISSTIEFVSATTSAGTGNNSTCDPLVFLTDATVVEGDVGTTNAAFIVTLSHASASTATITYATANGTATSGVDYVSSGTNQVVFLPGVRTQVVTVAVNGDTTVEPEETFFLRLLSAINARLLATQAVGRIVNDDVPQVSIGDATVGEGNAGSTNAIFILTLNAPFTNVVTVFYATSNGTATATSDYNGVSGGVVTFNIGSTTTSLVISVLGDLDTETNETFFVLLTNAINATIGDGLGMGTITNDDVPLAGNPAVDLQKTIYRGQNGGASCPGGELATGTNNTAVTYCFVVSNSGDRALSNVTVSDPTLAGFTTTNLGSLATGQVVGIFFQTTQTNDVTNTASVVATPPIGTNVMDADTAVFDRINPAIQLQKTVYIGQNGGASCPGSELVLGTNGTAITYCFRVSNIGDTALTNVVLADGGLAGFGVTNLGTLATGAIVTVHFDTAIAGDLLNSATVTASAATGDVVGDDDTAAVDQVAPGVDLQKTVYLGHNGGASCPGSELVTGTNGAAITYCFRVSNIGDTALTNVVVADGGLAGFGVTNLGTLATGAIVTVHFETTITADRVNSATVTASTVTGIVADNDTAAVDQVAPTILLQKTVYLGHNGGASCPGSELVTGTNGAAITYCFRVSNVGDTMLTNIVLADGGLPGFGVTNLGTLATGAIVNLSFETAITADRVNSATVTASSVNGLLASDDDTATVDQSAPGILLEKSVYTGHNGGASCPGSELVAGIIGTPITYCFRVSNIGDTTLTNIVLADGGLSGFGVTNLGTLVSGAVASVFFQSTLILDRLNTATVTASSVSGPMVSDTDTAAVDRISPSILLQKTVYLGHNGGASCPGSELVTGTNGTAITYCFRVSNTGDSSLTNVVLADGGLAGFGVTNLGTLATGAVVSVNFQTTITADRVNSATVTAGAVSGSLVSDDDTAAVDQLAPAIQLQKSVYIGHNGGASCPGLELVIGTNGTLVTYCFRVSNIGDQTLTNVVLSDAGLPGFASTNLGTLATGVVVSTFFQSTITVDRVNSATVTAVAVSGQTVVDDDTAAVDALTIAEVCGAYTVTDLGTLGGNFSKAEAISDSGLIVGQARRTNGLDQAFIWQDGVITNLFSIPAVTNSFANSINSRGQVVGYLYSTDSLRQGFFFSNGNVRMTGYLSGGNYSELWEVNNSNVAAGAVTILSSTNPTYKVRAVRWSNGVYLDLGSLLGEGLASDGFAINDIGLIAGMSERFTPSQRFDPFVWEDLNGNGTNEPAVEMQDLGGLGGVAGYALGINELRQAVGWAATSGYSPIHAFLSTPVNGLYDNDTVVTNISPYMIDLGVLPGGTNSEAVAINDAGDVVGYSESTGGVHHAFYYTGGVMYDLNKFICTNSGWLLQQSRDINNAGQIVGFGVVSGQTHGFLLTVSTNSLELTKIVKDSNSAAGRVLYWRGLGPAQMYTVEASTSLISGTWSPAPPTNQWPILTPFWADNTGTNAAYRLFRVRGEPVP